MSRFVLVVPTLVGLAMAVPASAVIFTSIGGAPDPGMASGEALLVSFDAPNAIGVRDTSHGNVITAAGSIGSVRAAPAGTASTDVYRSIGSGGESLFDFSGWSGGRPLTSASFYWGSIDTYNFVDFLDAGGRIVGTMGGGDLPGATGNQSLPDSNRRVFFNFAPEEGVTALRLRSNGTAFEFDNIAASIGAVPEPASWAMMIAGFGCIGIAMRRHKAATAAA